MKAVSDNFHHWQRNCVWCSRRRVPEPLVPAIGRKVIQFSLKTPYKAKA